jgi:hypothetical protein
VATKKTYTVFAADPDEKEGWMTAMNQVIDALVAKNPSLLGTPHQHKMSLNEGANYFYFDVQSKERSSA